MTDRDALPALHELYDADTVREIDAWSPGARPRPVGGARGSALAGALFVAGLAGGRDALEEAEPEVVEVVPDAGLDRTQAVTILFVPDAPRATVAVVRPWLLDRPFAVGRVPRR